MTAVTVLILIVAGFLAWLVSLLGGGGGALLLIPVITWVKDLGPRAVAPVLAIVTLVDSPVRIALFWRHIDWRIVRWYLPGAIVGGFLGAYIFANAQAHWLKVLAALFLISTVIQYRFGAQDRSFTMRAWAFLPLGFIVAFVSGLIGEAGPVLNPFYLNYGAVKEQMIATKSVNSFAMQFTKLTTYATFGAMEWKFLYYGLILGAAAMTASWVGKKLLGRMHPRQFRLIVVTVMAVTGALMLYQERGWLLSWFDARVG